MAIMAMNATAGGRICLVLAVVLSGCGKVEQNDPQAARTAKVEAKRQQARCGSAGALDQLKQLLFDQATRAPGSDAAALDGLADYSFVRMESPVVKGWDPALQLTRCAGRLILEVPNGARRAFAGERSLQADIDYTAQPAADGRGLVYALSGAEPILAKLVAFQLNARAYQPPPAIDEQPEGSENEAVETTRTDASPTSPNLAPAPPRPTVPADAAPPPRRNSEPERGPERIAAPSPQTPERSTPEGGEATVRAFYNALGVGDGASASARVIPEKRNSRAFSPDAISQFYGRLAEPLRLTEVVPTANGAYRVRYRYSTGRSQCNGVAVVRVVKRAGRDYIRSIDALSGC
jgi:hypothetical protein